MNTPKIATVSALIDRSVGWAAELLGHGVGHSALVSMGQHRQLRATVALHCAQVQAHATQSMRSWKVLDTRLLYVNNAAVRR